MTESSARSHMHGLRYCPQVPNLALIMLSYLSEAEVFTAMVRARYPGAPPRPPCITSHRSTAHTHPCRRS